MNFEINIQILSTLNSKIEINYKNFHDTKSTIHVFWSIGIAKNIVGKVYFNFNSRFKLNSFVQKVKSVIYIFLNYLLNRLNSKFSYVVLNDFSLNYFKAQFSSSQTYYTGITIY